MAKKAEQVLKDSEVKSAKEREEMNLKFKDEKAKYVKLESQVSQSKNSKVE